VKSSRLSVIPRTIVSLVEPAVRSLAHRLFVLTGGRAGSEKHKVTIDSFYETGIVVSLFEFLLMSPELAHLEIRHENPYKGTTRPFQVDLWIRPPNGGYPHLVEAGDFTPGKLRADAAKMRGLNKKGLNWFLAFFREEPASRDPMSKLRQARKRKRSLKSMRIEIDERLLGSFAIKLPGQTLTHFGYALIRVK
jgi:hypothetical protein